MVKVKRNSAARLKLDCDDPSDSFEVSYTNMGEPYREGITIGICNDEFNKDVQVMLCDREAKQLRDVLLQHYPIDTPLTEKKTNSPYGFCPKCGMAGSQRERRMGGLDRCPMGHTYPSVDAIATIDETR
jgi:hypothetical protein